MKVVYIIDKSLVKLPQTKIQIINHLHKYLLWGKVQRGHRLRRTGSHASLSCGSHNVVSSTLKKVNNNNNNNKKKKYNKNLVASCLCSRCGFFNLLLTLSAPTLDSQSAHANCFPCTVQRARLNMHSPIATAPSSE